jgi:hypothetical protein
VATYFETLPPEDENEDYYEATKMPISLGMIENKLNGREFTNLSELESYFKRMVTNAKDFYSRGSEVFDDAERVRKALSNYMVKTNPAYKLTPGYTCQPTPLPDDPDAQADEDDEDGEDDEDDEEEDEEEQDEESEEEVKPRRRPGRPPKKTNQAAQAKLQDKNKKIEQEYEGIGYDKLNFQQAQEKIVEELIVEEDPE